MPLPPGTRLGSYEIQALIGAGGMGEVYRARDGRLGREVAIKVVPAAIAGSPDRQRRFELEARAAASLSHPNIRAIHDLGVHHGSSYLVMELLSGETLRERLGGRPLPPRKAAEIALQVARGLAAAHQKGIVHRDLKPENLFLTRDGLVKILDFGLAKAFLEGTGDEQSTLGLAGLKPETSEGQVLGTVGYLSPEQVRGGKVDARSDLFAFGIVLWEMMTGERPFRGASAVETMNAILKDELPPVDPALDLPPVLVRVAACCLEKDPAARFQSAHDLAFALEALSGASSTQALEIRGQPPSRGRRRWGIAAGAAAAALLAATAWGLGALRVKDSVPVFRRLTYLRGTLEQALFTNQGATVRFSARLEGRASALYELVQGTPEAIPMGEEGTTLVASSVQNDLAVLRGARIVNGFVEGTLARANPAGTGLKDLGESMVCADWSPDARTLAVVRRKEAFDGYTVECPMGRVLWSGAGAFQVLDADDRDRLLLAHHRVQHQSEIQDADGAFPRILSWLGACWTCAFSLDGASLLFNAEWRGESGLYLWKARGATPIRLGPGTGLDFTADSAGVLAHSPKGQLFLLPLGPGIAKDLVTGTAPLDKAWAFPGGRRILYHLLDPPPDGVMGLYDLDTGQHQTVGEPGEDAWTGQNPISPDGARLALVRFGLPGSALKVAVAEVDGKARKPVREVQAQDVILGFSPDGKGLLVFDRCAIPVRIDRIDLASGRREAWKSFTPSDPVGVRGIDTIVLSRDGRRMAFNYRRTLSDLFIVEGLS